MFVYIYIWLAHWRGMHAFMQLLATIPFSVLVGVYFNLHIGSDLTVYRSEKLSRIMNMGDWGKIENEVERSNA